MRIQQDCDYQEVVLRRGWALDAMSHRDLAAKTATFAAAANIGASFAPNLLPRKPIDQAIATGLSASISYGVANLTQSFIDGMSRRIAPGRDRAPTDSRKYLTTIAIVTAIAGGMALQKLFVAKHGEPVKRAAVRTIGWELTASGFAGLGITAAVGGMEEVARRRGGSLHPAVLPVGFIVGTMISAVEVLWYRRHQEDSAPIVNSLAQGTVVMAGVTTVGYAETQLAGLVALAVRRTAPGLALLAEPIGHAVGLGLLAAGVGMGVEVVNRRAEQGGAAIEAAYLSPTESSFVSGGSNSEVSWKTLSREGRRFVNMALTPTEIADVTGHEGVAPIRAFVGLDSADSVDARVWLMMTELEKLGAFERSVICLSSPTGTGYINYVASETLEYLTRGDCATIGIQYSLRPSFLSLDKVKIGREQNRALLHAISGRLMGIPKERRPRLVVLGESLGAFTLQDAFLHEGTSGLKRAGVSNALFIGTPAESKWAEQWRLDPQRFDPTDEVVEVDSYQEWLELPPEIRATAHYILLSHHEDPITKFSPALAVQTPRWLSDGDTRSPAIVEGVDWRPFTTFILTAVDMKNATDVIPGKFEAFGHDYRADLARFTSLAFELPVDEDELARIELALRQRELKWAAERANAEAREQAKESIARTLNSWGVTTDELPAGIAGLAARASISGGTSV
ncbi:MAG: alpha/beta-hydrolase family protein [Actinobacteria bacterium]|nr:alpha/beta-hydrolase family protein [Actinomycetota bacterium]